MIDILHPVDDADRIDRLLAAGEYRYVDGFAAAATELATIDALAARHGGDTGRPAASRYVVYPWRRTLVRLPDADTFLRLRTARNRYLVSTDEQDAWARALIGIAGLSVGASVLSVCSLTGARRFRLADPDVLAPTNLNRLAGSVCDLGESKLTLARRRTLETDPYSSVEGFADGYTPRNAAAFLGTGGEKLAVALEEMDDLAMKIDLRRRARAARIPVVMATDQGDNILLDIERYDLDGDYPLFHGRAGDLERLDLDELNDPRRRVAIASAIVGDEIVPRLRYSLAEVGRSIPSWPQLGTAASLAGVVGALTARLLVCGHDLESGRYRFDIDRVLHGDRSAPSAPAACETGVATVSAGGR